jgi:hypothetical protein
MICGSLFADLKPIPILYAEAHTMEEALYGYMDLKVHEWVREGNYTKILVVGDYERSSGISKYEKSGKPFNWQRPTAAKRGQELIIKCYPSRAYVKHYAELIATYLALHNKKWNHVRYELPDESVTWKQLAASNLKEVPRGDVLIMGFGLDILAESHAWQGKGAFSWIEKRAGGEKIVYLGCRHSYWGETSEKIVQTLAQMGFKKVIYVGKVGGLSEEGIPNESLATGSASYVEGEIVHWQNLFEFAKSDPTVVFGDNYTIPSVLNETKEWWNKNEGYAFVDNEIGFMARAAVTERIGFSYLHIISDNLNASYGENLVNERSKDVKEKRAALLQKVKKLIETSLRLCGLEDKTKLSN